LFLLSKIFYKSTTSKSPVDPSSFLKSLSDVVLKSGNTNITVSSQHDAPEILHYLLSECAVASPDTSNLFEAEVSVDSFCEICDIPSSYMEMDCIIRLPASRSVSCSVKSFFRKLQVLNFVIFVPKTYCSRRLESFHLVVAIYFPTIAILRSELRFHKEF